MEIVLIQPWHAPPEPTHKLSLYSPKTSAPKQIARVTGAGKIRTKPSCYHAAKSSTYLLQHLNLEKIPKTLSLTKASKRLDQTHMYALKRGREGWTRPTIIQKPSRSHHRFIAATIIASFIRRHGKSFTKPSSGKASRLHKNVVKPSRGGPHSDSVTGRYSSAFLIRQTLIKYFQALYTTRFQLLYTIDDDTLLASLAYYVRGNHFVLVVSFSPTVRYKKLVVVPCD